MPVRSAEPSTLLPPPTPLLLLLLLLLGLPLTTDGAGCEADVLVLKGLAELASGDVIGKPKGSNLEGFTGAAVGAAVILADPVLVVKLEIGGGKVWTASALPGEAELRRNKAETVAQQRVFSAADSQQYRAGCPKPRASHSQTWTPLDRKSYAELFRTVSWSMIAIVASC